MTNSSVSFPAHSGDLSDPAADAVNDSGVGDLSGPAANVVNNMGIDGLVNMLAAASSTPPAAPAVATSPPVVTAVPPAVSAPPVVITPPAPVVSTAAANIALLNAAAAATHVHALKFPGPSPVTLITPDPLPAPQIWKQRY
ncbi:hypothetical protein BV22DRAFT_1134982 [Leucogyrophana mollusca]|uniref:Uncharacterized protein n=1 Tax=Leucogyrophana mollusca TaxID=85980 RepID=A0ACB8AX19_9AGAM|nr:hypothetical protein BV22DRAFT_1134982 [Leucogyrophana mollusca]